MSGPVGRQPDFFGVKLDGSEVYFGGQTVTGKVILQTDEDLTLIESIKVKLKGEGDVHWTERRKRTSTDENGKQKTEHYTVHYRNEETYVKTKHLLHTGNVAVGNHEYSFSFQLPNKLPCSFEGSHGNVRYRVQAKLKRKGSFTMDKKSKKFITVNTLVDLNGMPSIKEPITLNNTKTFGCCCWITDPLSQTVNLPRTGYAPGESIPVNAEIENLSDKEMNKSQAILIQKVAYKGIYSSKSKTKTTERKIQEVTKGKVEAGGSESWEGVEVRIPSIPPSNLGGMCSIISINYELQFRVDPSGFGFDLVTKIPITIGTVPLRAVFQSWTNYTGSRVQSKQQEKISEGFVAPTIPPSTAPPNVPPSAPPIPLEGFDDLPPPTYEQAISADEDGKPTNMRKEKDSGEGIEGNWDYHPVYPIWPSAPPPQPPVEEVEDLFQQPSAPPPPATVEEVDDLFQ